MADVEIGTGIVNVYSRTAALIYSGESGGLNEGTSDIFGSMIQAVADDEERGEPGDPAGGLAPTSVAAAASGLRSARLVSTSVRPLTVRSASVIRPLSGLVALRVGWGRDRMGDRELSRGEELATAWFGVRGVGSLYYLAYAARQADFRLDPLADLLHPLGVLAVGAFVDAGADPVQRPVDVVDSPLLRGDAESVQRFSREARVVARLRLPDGLLEELEGILNRSVRLTTDRGVFSHGHLDTGTAILLREAPPPPRAGPRRTRCRPPSCPPRRRPPCRRRCGGRCAGG